MLDQDLVQAAIQDRSLDAEKLWLERQAQTETSTATPDIRFLTSTARVLATVIRQPGSTIREIARRCDQTERAVWVHLKRLEGAGFLRRRRVGRRNSYVVDLSMAERQLLFESEALLGS